MRWSISAKIVPTTLPYADAVNAATTELEFPPCVAYAIFWRETIRCERSGLWNAATIVSGDGGYGIGQLTPSTCGVPLPANWMDPATNVHVCIEKVMLGGFENWAARGFTGDALIKLGADDYNAGDGAVERHHDEGNADDATTGDDYGSDVLTIFHNLIAGRDPDHDNPYVK